MAKQTINIGTADKGDGDPIRTAFTKVNANFTELYTALGLDSGGLNLGSFEFTDNTITTTDSSMIIIDQSVRMTSELEVGGDIVPNIANEHTLGTLAKPFKSLYVSNSTIYLGGTPLAVNQSGQLTIDGSVVSGGGADLGDVTIDGSQLSATTGVIEVKGSVYAQLTGGSDENRVFVNDNVGARITVGDAGHDWTFNPQGNLILPAKFPIQFTAVFDAAHYTGLAAFQGDGTASFNVGLNRQGAQLSWTADDPTFNTNKGYIGQQNFRYTEADHGITGFNVDILMEMMGPDPDSGDYALNVSFSPEPSIMQLAKVRSTDEMIISAAASAWLFASEGDLYLPPNGTIRDSGGNSVIFSDGQVLTAVGTDISLLSGDDIWIQGKDLPGTDSEGGDVYIRGGTGDPGNSGGDIQILAGNAGSLDGPGDTGNTGGDISIVGGEGYGYSNRGGNVTLQAGLGEYNQGGAISITSGAGGVVGSKLYQGPVSFIDNTNPVRVALAVAHNLNTGDAIYLTGITTATELNDKKFYVVDFSSTEVDLYYDRDINTAVDGTGMTSWASTVTTAINNNLVSTSTFAGDSNTDPNIANVVVGDYVYGGSLPGKKAITAIQFIAPSTYNIDIDGTDGSVFDTGVIYTFKRPDGGGIADSTAHGGDSSINAGSAANNNSGDSGSINFSSGELSWKFKYNGNTLFPILNVPISDNANPSGTGQTLKFDNSAYQAIIYGPSASVSNTSAERIIIQGAPGYTGTAGEGGDVYLWAGPGGSSGGDGGDIKIRAGRGQTTGNGGYLNFQAGNSTDGTGGYINIESGSSSNGTGGNITIDANSGGHLDLYTAAAGVIRLNTAGGANVWTFTDTGNLQVPNGTTIIHDGFTIGSEGSYAFIDIPNNANSNLNDGLRISNQNGPVSITSFLQSPGTVRTWIFNTNGGLELPGGGSLATNSYDVGLLAGNDGNSTFGSVTINTQFSPAVYTVTQEGGMPAGAGANTITGNISNSPSASSIVAGMTVTGLNLIGVTTVTSATVDMGGNFTIITDADEVDPFAYSEVYTFTAAEPQDRNWEFNSLGELNLPQGGVIQETTVTNELWGTTTTSMTLVPGGALNGTQRLEIYSTGGGEGDHIHITSGDQNQTDLFLGNDTQYYAVAASGANYIQARSGADSTGPGVSAGAGANVNIYGGNAGDNGGNVADGNSGGDVFIASGISTSGLGGQIYLQTSLGPTGFGSIKLSTDGGSSYLEFNEANQLVFPATGTIRPLESTSTAGNPLTVRAGDSETQVGGNLILRGGDTIGNVGTPRNSGYAVLRAGSTVTGNGGYAELLGGNTTAGDGGQAYVTAGSTTTGNGGPVEITAGDTVTGDGGSVTIESGEAVTGTAGNINITAKGTVTGDGGNVNLTGGSVTGGNGGAINLTAGDTIGSGDPGTIRLRTFNAAAPQDWTFGFDGNLTFPDATVQTTAFTTDPTLNVLTIEDGVHERFQTKTDATGTVQHNCALGHIFYHTSPDANWTANFTNLNLSSNYATAVTLIIVQGGTGYYPSAVQIGGVGQTLNWQGNTTPTPSTNRTDVVTFSIINNSGTYTVLGQLTGF